MSKNHAVPDNGAGRASKLELALGLGINDFKTRFAGSFLGAIWALIVPMVTVLMYWFVFQIAMGSDQVDGHPFVLWLIAGLTPWMFFQEAAQSGCDALRSYSYLVKKVTFDIEILPMVKVMSAFVAHLGFLVIVLILYTAMGRFPGLWLLQVLYFSFCLAFLTLGMAYLTSAVTVFFQDMRQLVTVGIQVGTWITPILWQLDRLPAKYHWLFRLNPVNYAVEGYRDALLYKSWFWERPRYMLYFWCVAIVIYVAGVRVFRKLRPHFADVL